MVSYTKSHRFTRNKSLLLNVGSADVGSQLINEFNNYRKTTNYSRKFKLDCYKNGPQLQQDARESEFISVDCKVEQKTLNKKIVGHIPVDKGDLKNIVYESVSFNDLKCSNSWKWSLNDLAVNFKADKLDKTANVNDLSLSNGLKYSNLQEWSLSKKSDGLNSISNINKIIFSKAAKKSEKVSIRCETGDEQEEKSLRSNANGVTNIVSNILCLNVKSCIGDRLRYNSPLVREIMRINPIAFFAIEAMQSKSSKECMEILNGYKAIFVPTVKRNSNGRGSGGAYLFFRENIWYNVETVLNRSEMHNISVIRLHFDQKPIICIIVHAPTDNYSIEIRSDFYNEFKRIVDLIPNGEKWFIMGDFNSKEIGIGINTKNNKNRFLKNKFCVDSSSKALTKHFNILKATFLSPQGFSSIDDVICCNRLISSVSFNVLDKVETWSDHCLINLSILNLSLSANNVEIKSSPKKVWVIKRSLLNVENFIDLTNKVFKSVTKSGKKLLNMRRCSKNKVNKFYEFWTATFNNLLRKVAGSKRVLNRQTNLVELSGLNELAENRVKGLSLLYEINKNLKEIRKW